MRWLPPARFKSERAICAHSSPSVAGARGAECTTSLAAQAATSSSPAPCASHTAALRLSTAAGGELAALAQRGGVAAAAHRRQADGHLHRARDQRGIGGEQLGGRAQLVLAALQAAHAQIEELLGLLTAQPRGGAGLGVAGDPF